MSLRLSRIRFFRSLHSLVHSLYAVGAGLLALAAADPAGAAQSVKLEIQRGATPMGPWSKVTTVDTISAGQGEYFRVVITEKAALAIPTNFVWVPPGTFTLGTPDTEPKRRSAEGPQTGVTIAHGFWMSRFEVTRREWKDVMGVDPIHQLSDPELPADGVSWEEAMEYCRELTERERADGRLPTGLVYRLPTEAEWEYACRAGTKTATCYGNNLSSTYANFDGAFPYGKDEQGPFKGGLVRPGQYPPNAWGLYDMHGNVWEWCMDWFASKLPGGRLTDPVAAGAAFQRALRGGAWHNEGALCRSGYRYLIGPLHRTVSSGLRPIIGVEL